MGINAQTQALMEGSFAEAGAEGRLRSDDVATHVLMSRALVYGLARMAADGHLQQAGIETEAAARLEAAVDLMLAGMFRD